MKSQLACFALACVAVLGSSANAPAFQQGGHVQPIAPANQQERESRIRQLIAEFTPNIASTDKNPNTQVLLKKLDEPLALHFPEETPYADVLKYIREASKGTNESELPMYLDPEAIKEAGIEPSSSVRIDLEGVRLKTTLRLLLKQLHLAYCVKDGLILISSPEGILDELREFETENVPADQRILSRPENRIP